MNWGCKTVLAFSTPPTSAMRKQQMAKFLKRKSLRLMSGCLWFHSHKMRQAIPPTNRTAKKQMNGEENQSFSSPFICFFAVLFVGGIACLILWEWNHKQPLINLKLFRFKNFAICCFLIDRKS